MNVYQPFFLEPYNPWELNPPAPRLLLKDFPNPSNIEHKYG